MIETNIFRKMPNIKTKYKSFKPDKKEREERQTEEPDNEWPYMIGIYEILHQISMNEWIDDEKFKTFIKPTFI
tara:strand:- start:421 stop:639 length:219 start_codon:yes stop_codon:yes gene_type:complete